MGRWFGFKVLLGCTCACLAASSANTVLGQESEEYRTSSQVSVATLRIPSKALKHYERAIEAVKNGREEETLQEAAKALEIWPDFAEVYLLLAAGEVSKKNYGPALQHIEMAQRIEPESGWAVIVLAGAYNGLHRYDDASMILNRLQQTDAATWQAKYEMARAQVGRGDVEGALQWSALVRKAAPEACNEAFLLRADALQMAHRWKEAIAEFDLYLASRQPQSHRTAVLAAKERLRAMVDPELAATLASR